MGMYVFDDMISYLPCQVEAETAPPGLRGYGTMEATAQDGCWLGLRKEEIDWERLCCVIVRFLLCLHTYVEISQSVWTFSLWGALSVPVSLFSFSFPLILRSFVTREKEGRKKRTMSSVWTRVSKVSGRERIMLLLDEKWWTKDMKEMEDSSVHFYLHEVITRGVKTSIQVAKKGIINW